MMIRTQKNLGLLSKGEQNTTDLDQKHDGITRPRGHTQTEGGDSGPLYGPDSMDLQSSKVTPVLVEETGGDEESPSKIGSQFRITS